MYHSTFQFLCKYGNSTSWTSLHVSATRLSLSCMQLANGKPVNQSYWLLPVMRTNLLYLYFFFAVYEVRVRLLSQCVTVCHMISKNMLTAQTCRFSCFLKCTCVCYVMTLSLMKNISLYQKHLSPCYWYNHRYLTDPRPWCIVCNADVLKIKNDNKWD